MKYLLIIISSVYLCERDVLKSSQLIVSTARLFDNKELKLFVAMKHNHDEETNSSIQNLSKPKPNNRTDANEDTIQRNHLSNHNKAQSCASKDKDKFDSKNVKNYFGNSSQLTPSNKKLNRNLAEHMLFKDLEYSQSIKSFCFTNNAGINSINEEDIRGNNEHYTHKPLNNGRKANITVREDFTNKINNNNIAHMLTSNVKLYEDKTTYCRPVLNYYNQQFIYKTMERNAKLKHLVKKLSIARQREKEKVDWNNFINELKNKHRYDRDDVLLEDVTPEIINDCDNSTFSWQKSRLCRNILQDFYGAYEMAQPKRIHGHHQQPPQNIQYLPSNTNPYCYPTSSMGRLIMLRRDQANYKYLKCKNEEPEKICNSEVNDDALAYKFSVSKPLGYKDMNLKNFKSSLVQVDNKAIPPFVENYKEDISHRKVLCRSNETNTVDKLNYITLESTNNSSLVNIENKLECLTEAINRFMVQIKSRKRINRDIKCKTVYYNTAEKMNKNLNMAKSDSLAMREKENKVLREVTANSSGSTLSTVCGSPSNEYNSNIKDILRKVETYNQVDFQKQYNKSNKPCSVQMTIEVPTKDCCTEVTKSLSKQKAGDEVSNIEEIITPETPTIQKNMLPIQRMTIAVNTDPLSFLALLRFSTETLKRLMSYMPNFDYLSYLSALSFLQTPRTTSYICKICGAAFDNPTKLSDHIHGHELGKTRDCCVCRHVLERARNSLYSCQYCGQHFTRAYCCELHQQSCAKRLGRCHNASSSLMLLR